MGRVLGIPFLVGKGRFAALLSQELLTRRPFLVRAAMEHPPISAPHTHCPKVLLNSKGQVPPLPTNLIVKYLEIGASWNLATMEVVDVVAAVAAFILILIMGIISMCWSADPLEDLGEVGHQHPCPILAHFLT